jgi:YD repeat-containing protein
MEVTTDDGTKYYYHKLSRVSRWERPDGETAARIAERLASQEAEAARRREERMASLTAAEAAAAAERVAASEHKEGVRMAIESWSERAGWMGIKHVKRAVKSGPGAVADAAVTWPKRSLAALLASLHTMDALGDLVDKDKPLLVPPTGWSWDGMGGATARGDVAVDAAASAAASASTAISDGAIKKAYLQAVRVLHPDKTASSDLAVRIAAESAFTVLSAVWEAVQDAKAGTLLGNATSNGAGAETEI